MEHKVQLILNQHPATHDNYEP